MNETKKCAQCGQEKPIEDFSKSYKNLCKACVAENTRDARKMVNLSKHPIVIKGKDDYVRREIATAAMQGLLPKFNNNGRMIFNCIDWPRDTKTPKIHSTQKPVPLLEFLIELFTDPNDVVIDPTAGSGSTLLAAGNLGRRAYGFEVNKEFVNGFYEKLFPLIQPSLFV